MGNFKILHAFGTQIKCDAVLMVFNLQGLTVSQARTMQEYYDNIDKRDPRKAVVVPKVDDEDISRFGTMILAFISIILVLVTLPFSLCYCVKVVQEYERAVIFRLGRLKKGGASGPGLFFILPCIDKYSCVDLRTVSYEVPPQEMLSRDSVTVSVDAVCFYKVIPSTIYHGQSLCCPLARCPTL